MNPRLLEAVREYQAEVEAGRKPNRREFLARFADVADELADCLDGLDFVHSAAPRLKNSDTPRPARPAMDMLNPEQPLGDFRLVREIGRGGMGIVYEAVQLSLGRRVALKVLPFAATLDPRQLQRFKTEAQAAAQLHHGHIVPVFFVGSERNVHFYAMQYIEGQTLAALIVDLRLQRSRTENRNPKSDTNSTSDYGFRTSDLSAMGPGAATIASQHSTDSRAFFRTVAHLGVQTAEALEHAHQQGVIHRDVKPANLLLDQRGCLWITDFGLARVQTDAGATMSGDVVGTVRYMSPEQALGKPLVDERTDVYSLGATLYELLTLTPVFDGRNRQDFMRQILECEPPSLRLHNPALPPDLETVVLKALAKAPEDRYASAQELADDLHRFLEDKPIQARRPTLLEKASKWSRRHRPLVGAAVLLLAVVVVGLAASTVVIAREQSKTQRAYDDLAREEANKKRAFDALADEQQRTKKAYDAERREHDRAANNLKNARRALAFFTQVIEDDLKGKPGLEAIRLKLLDQALTFYQAFIEDYRDDPDTSAELAEICETLAPLLNELGAKADAVALLEQARRFQDMRGPGTGFGGPGGPPGFGGPRGGGGAYPLMPAGGLSAAMLLGQQTIQQDLKLTADQVKEIGKLLDRPKPPPPPRDGRRPSDAERAKRQTEAAEVEKKLTDLLQPEQTKRLQQLIWQQRGTHALGDNEVADALGLSDEQRERIRIIQEAAQRDMLQPKGGGPHRPDAFPRSDDFWKDVSEKTLVVLTADQRAKWKQLMGEPFHGEVRIGQPRFDPRP